MFGKKKEEEKTTTEEIKEEVKPEGEKQEGVTETEEIKEGEKKEEKTAVTDEKKDDENAAKEEGNAEDQPDPNEVNETEDKSANAARIDDLVTKDELAEKFAALEAKLDAVIKENASLNDQLTKVKEKYEDKDFGGLQKQGMVETNKVANDTFDEYSKAYMPK